jgi:hypothetical protein
MVLLLNFNQRNPVQISAILTEGWRETGIISRLSHNSSFQVHLIKMLSLILTALYNKPQIKENMSSLWLRECCYLSKYLEP